MPSAGQGFSWKDLPKLILFSVTFPHFLQNIHGRNLTLGKWIPVAEEKLTVFTANGLACFHEAPPCSSALGESRVHQQELVQQEGVQVQLCGVQMHPVTPSKPTFIFGPFVQTQGCAAEVVKMNTWTRVVTQPTCASLTKVVMVIGFECGKISSFVSKSEYEY